MTVESAISIINGELANSFISGKIKNESTPKAWEVIKEEIEIDPLLTLKETAILLTITYPIFRKWISNEKFPKPIRLNESKRYRESTIHNWIKEQEKKGE